MPVSLMRDYALRRPLPIRSLVYGVPLTKSVARESGSAAVDSQIPDKNVHDHRDPGINAHVFGIILP
jgi:hypothetical protein